jgi:hypothetical protein
MCLYGVTVKIEARIRLVIANRESTLLLQPSQQRFGDPSVPTGQNTKLPRVGHSVHLPGITVDRQHDRAALTIPTPGDGRRGSAMIRPEERVGARILFSRHQTTVPRYDRPVTDHTDRCMIVERPIIVDHQSAIIGQNGRGVKSLRQPPCHISRTDIDRDMEIKLRRVYTQGAK